MALIIMQSYSINEVKLCENEDANIIRYARMN